MTSGAGLELDRSAPVATATPALSSGRSRPGLRFVGWAVGCYLASRIVTSLALLLAHLTTHLSLPLIVSKWDAHWYLSVAQLGYPSSPAPAAEHSELRLAFFPLFPLLLRPITTVAPNPLLAATLVAAVLGLAATVAVAALGRTLAVTAGASAAAAARTGLRAAALFAFFPGALVLSLAYTEGLTILLIVGCLVALLRRRWLAAGVLAGLATAARPNALALVLACGWASYDAIRHRRDLRSLLAPVLAPAGFVGYLAYLQIHTGSWRSWGEVENRAWHQSVDLSAQLIRLLTPHQIAGHLARLDWQYFSLVGGLVFVLLALLVYREWRPPAVLTAYLVGVLGFCFLSSHVGPRPRMLLLAVPLFLGLGARLRPVAFRVLLAGSALATLGLTYLVSIGRAIP